MKSEGLTVFVYTRAIEIFIKGFTRLLNKTGVTAEWPPRKKRGDPGKHLDRKVKISISDILVPKTSVIV